MNTKTLILTFVAILITPAALPAQIGRIEQAKADKQAEQERKVKTALYPKNEQPVRLWHLYPKNGISKGKYAEANLVVRGKLAKVYVDKEGRDIIAAVIEDEKGKEREYPKAVFFDAERKVIQQVLANHKKIPK